MDGIEGGANGVVDIIPQWMRPSLFSFLNFCGELAGDDEARLALASASGAEYNDASLADALAVDRMMRGVNNDDSAKLQFDRVVSMPREHWQDPPKSNYARICMVRQLIDPVQAALNSNTDR
jgi:hypothetical protein